MKEEEEGEEGGVSIAFDRFLSLLVLLCGIRNSDGFHVSFVWIEPLFT